LGLLFSDFNLSAFLIPRNSCYIFSQEIILNSLSKVFTRKLFYQYLCCLHLIEQHHQASLLYTFSVSVFLSSLASIVVTGWTFLREPVPCVLTSVTWRRVGLGGVHISKALCPFLSLILIASSLPPPSISYRNLLHRSHLQTLQLPLLNPSLSPYRTSPLTQIS
jgi:hypothetical protein